MSSIYHILDKVPAIYSEEMEIEYELLAQQLIKSGKLRIDTDDCCNFARFSDPRLDISFMVSKEELTSPPLIYEMTERFKYIYKYTISDKRIEEIFIDLKKQIHKLQPVKKEVAEKLARLFVQSAHPIVIKWLLHDKVEVFITYSHNIGDMMNITDWQQAGSNSGMQSTDGKNVAIFVSCGGDPFGEPNKDHPLYGNGWPAVARLQIIAAQEIGHFADIKRDNNGKQIGRHSANFSGTRASLNVKKGRIDDISNCNQLLARLLKAGLKSEITYEKKLKFYHQNKVFGIRVLWAKFLGYIYKKKVLSYAKKNKLFFVQRFVVDQYMGLMIAAMIDDMKFNLSPMADVYKNQNPEIEEAIACIEALARVPQQVMKWGYLTTKETMKSLYKIYYNEVIPSLTNNYSEMTSNRYKRNFTHPNSFIIFLQKLNIFNKKAKLKPIRDL